MFLTKNIAFTEKWKFGFLLEMGGGNDQWTLIPNKGLRRFRTVDIRRSAVVSHGLRSVTS
jgi:hypothetical protein